MISDPVTAQDLLEEAETILQHAPRWVMENILWAGEDPKAREGTARCQSATLALHHYLPADEEKWGRKATEATTITTYHRPELESALEASQLKCSLCVTKHGLDAAFPAVGFVILGKEGIQADPEALRSVSQATQFWRGHAGPWWGRLAGVGFSMCAYHTLLGMQTQAEHEGISDMDTFLAAHPEQEEVADYYLGKAKEQAEQRRREWASQACSACGKHTTQRWRFTLRSPFPTSDEGHMEHEDWPVCRRCRDLLVKADDFSHWRNVATVELAKKFLKGVLSKGMPEHLNSIGKLKREGLYQGMLDQKTMYMAHLARRLDAPVEDKPYLWTPLDRDPRPDTRLAYYCDWCLYGEGLAEGCCNNGWSAPWLVAARTEAEGS